MSVDIDSIPIKSEEQKKWWLENRGELSSGEQQQLFEKLVSNNEYRYNTLLFCVGLESDEPEMLLDNLERLSNLIDADLSWGPAFREVPNLLEKKNPQISGDVFRQLRDQGSRAYEKFGAYFLKAKSPESLEKEIIGLLSSVAESDIVVGLRATAQEYRDLPDSIVEQVHTLFDQKECLNTLIWFASRYLDKGYGFWDKLVWLGTSKPDYLPQILQSVQYDIGDKHLAEYLRLLRLAMDEGVVERPDIYNLYRDFAHRSDLLADFTVWLSSENSAKTWELSEKLSEENPEYLEKLFERIDEFESQISALFTLVHASQAEPEKLVNLTLQEIDEDEGKESFLLELLRKAIGELFDDSGTHRETVEKIYDFLIDRYSDEPFVGTLNKERVGLIGDEEYNEGDALTELKEFLPEAISSHKFDESLFELLDKYDNLSDHFGTLVERKLEQRERHPVLMLLKDESYYLDFLEDNWSRIPPEKKEDLLSNTGFSDFLSEIMFLVYLDEKGVDYETEVPLHHYQEGNVIGNVDVVINDIYIDIHHPKMWKPLSLSNRVRMIPNTAERKILRKFKNKFLSTGEMSEKPCFIALDIGRSEIDEEQIRAALHGSLKVRIFYDEETGEVVDERALRDPEESLEDSYYLLNNYLNGVIWYRTDLVEENERVIPSLNAGVVPNPEHLDGKENINLCKDIQELLE